MRFNSVSKIDFEPSIMIRKPSANDKSYVNTMKHLSTSEFKPAIQQEMRRSLNTVFQTDRHTNASFAVEQTLSFNSSEHPNPKRDSLENLEFYLNSRVELEFSRELWFISQRPSVMSRGVSRWIGQRRRLEFIDNFSKIVALFLTFWKSSEDTLTVQASPQKTRHTGHTNWN